MPYSYYGPPYVLHMSKLPEYVRVRGAVGKRRKLLASLASSLTGTLASWTSHLGVPDSRHWKLFYYDLSPVHSFLRTHAC
jgi:hypothetical protein